MAFLWASKSFLFAVLLLGSLIVTAATIVVIIGLWGEFRKSSLEWFSLHPLFEKLVIIGIAGELIGNSMLLISSYRLDAIEDQQESELLDELTPGQLEYGKFTNDLAGIAPAPIIIEAEPDSNSQFFAADLNAAFRQAEWPQRSIVNEAMSFIPGVWVKYLYPPTSDNPHKAAQAICRALNEQLLFKARTMPAMTLEAEHERSRLARVPEYVWNIQHEDGRPSTLDWPSSAPPSAVVIHVGPNRNNFFFNNARRKKGLMPLPEIPDSGPPCGRQ